MYSYFFFIKINVKLRFIYLTEWHKVQPYINIYKDTGYQMKNTDDDDDDDELLSKEKNS